MTLAERLIEMHLDRTIAGAVFDFMGYLTTHDEDIAVGRNSEVPPLLDRFKVWAAERGLDTDDADVMHWNEQKKPTKKKRPKDTAAIPQDYPLPVAIPPDGSFQAFG